MLRAGQVNPAGLRTRIKQAHRLAFHYENEELAAIAALKRPSAAYWARVFRGAEAPYSPDAFTAELGWVFTRKEHRGQGITRRLLQRLLHEDTEHDRLFATTSVDNAAMRHLLATLGFAPSGVPFSGADETLLQLWLRDAEPAAD